MILVLIDDLNHIIKLVDGVNVLILYVIDKIGIVLFTYFIVAKNIPNSLAYKK